MCAEVTLVNPQLIIVDCLNQEQNTWAMFKLAFCSWSDEFLKRNINVAWYSDGVINIFVCIR